MIVRTQENLLFNHALYFLTFVHALATSLFGDIFASLTLNIFKRWPVAFKGDFVGRSVRPSVLKNFSKSLETEVL